MGDNVARINIQECWWSDPRRTRLIRSLRGDVYAADGLAMSAWRLAQEFWKEGRRALIPKARFELLEGASAILEAGLAEAREEGIYVRGSCDWLEWINESKENGSAGGRKSAQVRQAKYGSAQPKARKPEAPPKGGSNEAPNAPKRAEPSLSSSSSGSNTNTEEKTKNAGASAPALPGLNENLPAERRTKFSEPTRQKMRGFFEAYAEWYKRKYGGAPECMRDKAIVGKVGHWIESVSEERAKNLIEVYCQIDYRPINEAQHDLWGFFRHLNRIGNALHSGQDPGGIDWGRVFGGQGA